MNDYTATFYEAITLLGFNKALAQFLLAAKLLDKSTVGQLIANLNSGGVTNTYLNKKIQ